MTDEPKSLTEPIHGRRYLSSALTFCYRFVFPAMWISLVGGGTVLLWLGRLHGRNNELPPPELKFVILVMWCAGLTFFLWVNPSLKRVRMDGQHLVVSDYFREIRIPFSAITDVRQSRWLTRPPVTIYFRHQTEFGDRVTFLPKRHFRFWRTNPIIDDLRQSAGLGPERR